MASFKDAEGRQWSYDINFGAILRVKSECGIDLLSLFSHGSAVDKLAADPQLLFDVIVAALRPQLDAAQVTPLEFAESLREDSVIEALLSLLEAIPDYFPERKRAAIRPRVDAVLRGIRNKTARESAAIPMATADELAEIERLTESPTMAV
jgi:hypothetical protein